MLQLERELGGNCAAAAAHAGRPCRAGVTQSLLTGKIFWQQRSGVDVIVYYRRGGAAAALGEAKRQRRRMAVNRKVYY